MKVSRGTTRKNKLRTFKDLPAGLKFLIIQYFFGRIFGIPFGTGGRDLYRFLSFHSMFGGQVLAAGKKRLIAKFRGISPNRIMIRRSPSSDLDVFQQVFVWEEYFPLIHLFKEKFSMAMVQPVNILDAGGNIGLTSLYFLKHFENCKIVSLEPDEENFSSLQYNVSGFRDKISVMNAALWSKNSRVEVINDFRDRLDWAKRTEEAPEGKVPAYTVSKIMEMFKWNRIDILKMDIEGAEKEIFNGEVAELDFLNRTRCLAMEIHDEFRCRSHIYDTLESYGFRHFQNGELTLAYRNIT